MNRMLFAVCFRRGEVFANILVEVTRTRSVHNTDVIAAALRDERYMAAGDLIGVFHITRRVSVDARTLSA